MPLINLHTADRPPTDDKGVEVKIVELMEKIYKKMYDQISEHLKNEINILNKKQDDIRRIIFNNLSQHQEKSTYRTTSMHS